MEKDIRINYMFTRIVKLLAVELYCTHTAACIFYYLATTLPPSQEGYTWIGSLKLGDYSYSQFREIDIWKRYITSLYFAIVTMATVGKFLSPLKITLTSLVITRSIMVLWCSLLWCTNNYFMYPAYALSLSHMGPHNYWIYMLWEGWYICWMHKIPSCDTWLT